MPTFLPQCGPNADPNIRKVRIADPMPPLRTFLAALHTVYPSTIPPAPCHTTSRNGIPPRTEVSEGLSGVIYRDH